MDKSDLTEQERVKELLKEIQLDQFYRQIHGKLHITRLLHFDHVTEEDLDDLGMAKPEQRRLFEALKKAKKKSLFSSFRRKKTKKSESRSDSTAERMSCYGVSGDALTCLISEQALTLFEMLGNGAFGYVRRGKWMKSSLKKVNVAVKCLKAWNDKAFIQMQMDFIKEANAMSLLDHPHIIKLYGIVLSTPMMLVTELAPLGCLLARLRNEPQSFTISGLSDFVVQIASGMAYLESQRFVHRDLAARNVLLESYEKVKISDFGMMRVLSEEDDHYTMHPSGKIPFAWCPQEVLKFRKFSHASDVWAFGITVLELFSYGMEPWPGLSGAEVLDKVDLPLCERPKKPDHCPPEIYNILITCCWSHEPHQRAKFAVLKKLMNEAHPLNGAAVYPYESKSPSNLSFQAGDIITLLHASPESSWWRGQNMRTKQVGMFPSELVEIGLRQAVSPPRRHVISPKQRTTSKKISKNCDQQLPNCRCGKPHIYETPILLDSQDLSTVSSSGSTFRSSRSVESDLTSSTEVDSGYSSGVDVRKLNLSSGEYSFEKQPFFSAVYENTGIVKQNTKLKGDSYELMSPACNLGAVSNPIPIPKQGAGEPRYVRNHHSEQVTSLSEERYPLDFSNSYNQNLRSIQNESPPALPSKMSASLPSPTVEQMNLKQPSISRTFSPPGSKKVPRETGAGKTVTQEMNDSLKEVKTKKSLDDPLNKPEEDDIYVELSRPVGGIPAALLATAAGNTSSKHPLKAVSRNSYENNFIPVKCDPQKERSVPDHECERIRCNSEIQSTEDRTDKNGRCNTWPTQQVYDNHKLSDGRESTTGSSYYDNHKINNKEIKAVSSDLSYDNWKITNKGFSLNTRFSEQQKSNFFYENVEKPVNHSLMNGEDSDHDKTTSEKSTNGSLNRDRSEEHIYENSLPSPGSLSYENFAPRFNAESDKNGINEVLYENCEVLDKGKNKSFKILSEVLSGNAHVIGSRVSEELSSSLPINCCCVDVVAGEHDENPINLIVEKRNLSPLIRSRSVDAIRQCNCLRDVDQSDADGSQQEFMDHPVPPPRWKRMARLNQTRSLDVCTKETWSVTVDPNIASALRRRWNGPVDYAGGSSPESFGVSQDPRIETSKEAKKPSLPSRSKAINLTTSEIATHSKNTYENVILPGKMSGEKAPLSCPPKLPPKKQRSVESNSWKMANSTRRAQDYENVRVLNSHPLECNGVVEGDKEDSTPPPLPRKMSQKGPPPIPFGVDLEQAC